MLINQPKSVLRNKIGLAERAGQTRDSWHASLIQDNGKPNYSIQFRGDKLRR
jgi:hypothetical protein